MAEPSALEAAQALIRAMGMLFGEVTVQAAAGEVTVVRMGTVYKPDKLAEIRPPSPPPPDLFS